MQPPSPKNDSIVMGASYSICNQGTKAKNLGYPNFVTPVALLPTLQLYVPIEGSVGFSLAPTGALILYLLITNKSTLFGMLI